MKKDLLQPLDPTGGGIPKILDTADPVEFSQEPGNSPGKL